MANTPNYDINYEDERFSDVKEAETQQLTEYEQTYNGMIGDTDKFYNDLKDNAQQWADKQSQIQQEQTDFTIEQIEQQKAQAQKDYTKEQAGAYVDWRKQSNQYGTEAEKMASAGLTNTGFSESSQVSMYNTYQNRVATARESYNQAVLNYNNAIKDARLQNNAALAEIAFNAFQQQAEYSLQAFQYKNQLVLDLADKKMQTKQFYADQWQRVLDQMNKENALAEEIRQFNENQAWQTEQAEIERQWKTKEAELDRQYQIEKDKLDRQHDKDMLEAKTKAEKELAEQAHKQALEKLDKQLANEKALAKYKHDLAMKAKSYTFSGGSSGSSGSKGGSSGSKSYGNTGYNFTKQWQSAGQASNKSSKSTTGKTTQATMNSITALGYGPISASKLNQLVASGEVIEYVSNGVTLFKRAKVSLPTTKLQSTLPKSASISLPTSKLRK